MSPTVGMLETARAAELLARQLHDQAQDLDPDVTPLWSVVDVTAAAAHLRAAARLVDRAADRIAADEVIR